MHIMSKTHFTVIHIVSYRQIMRLGSLILSWGILLSQRNLHASGAPADGGASSAVGQNDTGRKAELVAAYRALEDFGLEANRVGRLTIELETLMMEARQLDELHEDLVTKTKALEPLIRHVNAVQIQGLIGHLDETLQREIERRERKTASENQIDFIDLSDKITKAELERRLNAKEILNETQEHLETWVMGLATDIIEQRRREMVVPQNVVQCVKPSEAVHVVQASLVDYLQDGTGKVDHAEGASIVYELTSNTYIPPPDGKDLLGNVWWRRYIPSDWEKLLPEGWKQWNARLPAYIYHSLVRMCV
jgi:hypothetical protein